MCAKHLLAIVAIATLPATGRAQLGGLITRAAKSAAEGRVVASATNQNVRPSETFGPELTASSLDAVIKGLAASDAKLVEAKQLHEEKDRLYIQSSQLSQAHDGERGRYNDRVRTIEQCQDSVVHVRGDAAREAYMARMKNDPAAQQEMMRASMAVSQQAAAAPNGFQPPKMSAASAMNPRPAVMFSVNALPSPIERYAPPAAARMPETITAP